MKRFLISVLTISALFLLSFITFSGTASARISACNSTGHIIDTFYTNESVYIIGNSTPDEDADVYIVYDKSSWANRTSLTGLSLGYKQVSANSTGDINVTILWDTPSAGTYDVILDVDRDVIYTIGIDAVDNTTYVGFTVLEVPRPTLTVKYGNYHPDDHDHDLETDTGHNVMVHLNISANSLDDIYMDSVAITAMGTGNEKNDIKVAYFIYDNNNDGEYDNADGDVMIGYSTFVRDDGAVFFELDTGGFLIPAGESRAFVVTYLMSTSGSVDDTYTFDVITITGRGDKTGDAAVVSGLPLDSAVKTISQAAPTTTTTIVNETTTTTTTTTTVPVDECQTDADCAGVSCSEKKKTTYTCEYDSAKGVNVCSPATIDVKCCGDADCVESFYCLNYKCVKERAGGLFGWLGELWGPKAEGEKDYTWTIVSIVVVVAAVIIVFLVIKNRGRRPWKTKKEYERDWEGLRRKWE